MSQKIKYILNRLEDPRYPLLGPIIKGLFWFGLWQGEYKYRDVFFNIVYFMSLVFVISQFVELFFLKNSLINVLFNITISSLGVVSICKSIFFIFYQSYWKTLFKNISDEEIAALKDKNPAVIKILNEYKNYSRTIIYLYWLVMFLTDVVTIFTPFLKYATTPVYREMIKNGTEPYPQILSSWFPFDKTKMPGYLAAVAVHILVVIQGTGVIASYDTSAVATMTFLKGQLQILRYKCTNIFGDHKKLPNEKVLDNIKECHRLHTFLIEQHKMFNSIISPVMFVYVLVCSIMICCSVVQLSLDETTTSQKLWVIEYTSAMTVQLFLYCWHSNEILYESDTVEKGVYASNWWQADVQVRRQVLLLEGKLAHSFILHAGPFTTLSMTTFINILKGSYSFYTLLGQMQENK